MTIGYDPVLFFLVVIPVAIAVAFFVRWWWLHQLTERLDRIAAALERQSSPVSSLPSPPTLTPEQAEAVELARSQEAARDASLSRTLTWFVVLGVVALIVVYAIGH